MSANSNVKVDITASASGMQPAVSQAEQNFAKLEASANKVDAQFNTTNQTFNKATLSAGQLRMATQQLPLQFTDIWVSLAAGQSPMMVMLQQGTQITGSFGGVSMAARAMSTYIMGLINPITVASAAIAAGAYAWYSWGNNAEEAAAKAAAAAEKLKTSAEGGVSKTIDEKINDLYIKRYEAQEKFRQREKEAGDHFSVDEALNLQKAIAAYDRQIADLKADKGRSSAAANQNFLDALQRESDTYGMTAGQIKIYEAEKKGIVGAEMKQVRVLAAEMDARAATTKATKDHAKAVEEANKIIADIDPLFKANQEWAKLLLLKEQNLLTDEQMGKAYEKVINGTQATADGMSEIWKNYRDSTQRVLGDQMFDAMMGKFTSLEDAFKQMIFRIAANAAAANLTEALFGNNGKGGSSSNGVIGSLMNAFGFGGGRAVGGSVASNTMYEVNEDGPEMLNQGGKDYLMMGGKGGFVKPLSQGGAQISGGSQIVIQDNTQIHIDARSDRAQALSEVSQLIDNKQAQLVDTLRRQKVIA